MLLYATKEEWARNMTRLTIIHGNKIMAFIIIPKNPTQSLLKDKTIKWEYDKLGFHVINIWYGGLQHVHLFIDN